MKKGDSFLDHSVEVPLHWDILRPFSSITV